ncbi:MAG: hypothetical protein IT301_04605 [Dehalococcoidia bacterium]|nr:hypothetical protein [Dehalococcoidia bacterium]
MLTAILLSIRRTVMLVMGDIKCLHCAHVSGRWVGAKGAPLTVSGLRGYQVSEGEDPQAPVRCARCDGPVFLDDASLVISSYRLRRIRRLREQIAAFDSHRAA